MAAGIWNKNVHTMAHLPEEVLNEVFQYVSGKDLFSLVGTCSDFKSFIKNNPHLIEKIAFRVLSLNNVPFYEEGTRVLALVSKHIKCLSISDLEIKAESGLQLLMGRYDWKHLKMRNCQFETADLTIRFLSAIAESLEIIDFDQVAIARGPVLSIAFPKLKILKTTHLQINFNSPMLKELELKCVYRNPGINPMMTHNIVVLTLTYSDINFFFKHGISYELAPNHIKKLTIRDYGHQNPISLSVQRRFQGFLKLQTNIEEISIETFGSSVDTLAAAKRILATIFKGMTSVRKLTVKNRHAINDLPEIELGQSPFITELCLDPPESKTSAKFFKKIIASCPNIKKLSIDTFDQKILQGCFEHMKSLETIDAQVVLIERGETSADKLTNLKHINFARIEHNNFKELSYLPLMTQKDFAFKMLKGSTNVLFV